MKPTISDRNRDIVLRRLNGEQFKDIAATYGVSSTRIQQVWAKTVQRFWEAESLALSEVVQ